MKYTVIILTAMFVVSSCEKNEVTFDATYSTGMALVQLHNEIPVPTGEAYNFMKVELNGVDLTADRRVPLNSWNSIPTSVSRYYETNTGTASIKLYHQVRIGATEPPEYEMVLRYDQSVALQEGKQGLIFYDFDKPPLVITEPDNILPYRITVDTDTVHYVRFFNLMREKPGVESDLKLQYQYQYVINPLYTLADLAAGKIPDGFKVGDVVPVENQRRSAWLNLGDPVGFGENTGWQLVPVKKTTYVSQGSARIDYRIVVTQGGEAGVTMTAGDNLLICANTRAGTTFSTNGYTHFLTNTMGRWAYHFFSGYRDGSVPGMSVVTYFQK